MSILTANDKQLLEHIFEMDSGYVLDFSNSTFQTFIKDCVGIDIYEDFNYREYCSKAKKLRQIWDIESDFIVLNLTIQLLEYAENYYLKNNRLSNYLEKSISKLQEKLVIQMENSNKTTLPRSEDETLDTLKKDIDKYILNNTPELALDRLHTFSVKYLQNLCESHSIDIYDDKCNKLPLHSLAGMLAKFYSENSLIESDFSVQALKTCISMFEKYNNVRNNQSYAHTNSVLKKVEAEFIVKTISDILVFIDTLERSNK